MVRFHTVSNDDDYHHILFKEVWQNVDFQSRQGYQSKYKPNVASIINNLLSSFIFLSNVWRKLIHSFMRC